MNDRPLAPKRTAPVPRSLITTDGLTAVVAGDWVGPDKKREYDSRLAYWHIVRRHKALVGAAACLGAAVAFLLTLSEPRLYKSTTTLEIESVNQDFLNNKSVNATVETGPSGLDADIQTQVQILQSRALNERVREGMTEQRRPANLQPADRLGMWRKVLKQGPPSNDQIWDEALNTAAGTVRARSLSGNHIVDVSCDSTHPQVAADFCNRLTQEFIEQNLEARWTSAEYTGQWVTNQLRDLKIKFEKQQEDLQAYAKATQLIFADDKTDTDETRLSDLQRELSVAQADRFTKQSKYEMASTSPPGALPDVLADPSVNDSQNTLATLKAKLAQLSVTFTENHPEVRRVQVQIDAIEASLGTVRASVVTRIHKEFETAQRREALIAVAYDTQARLVASKSEERAHYSLLKRDADATHLMYETLQQRLKEASIASALRANNIRIVDTAQPAAQPYKPVVLRQVVYGLAFGLVVGLVIAVLRDGADRTLHDPGDIGYYLGVSELGVVPIGSLNVSSRLRGRLTNRGLLSAGTASLSDGAGGERIELVSWDKRSSILAESFRTTLTSILFSRHNGDRPRVLLVTSASPQEGKTTIVSNLGIALAQINQNVLVIDGDMRRPRLHSVFDLDNRQGLSDLLVGETAVDSQKLNAACQPTSVPGLFVMTSGGVRGEASTIVHSPRLAESIELAREQFDTIIIDTPPMLNIADARILARVGDGLILVVRAGTTTRDAALLATSTLVEDGTPVLGTILNFWNSKSAGSGYDKYYAAEDSENHHDPGPEGNGRQANGRNDTDGDNPAPRPEPDPGGSPASLRTARTTAIERWIEGQRSKT